MILNLCDWENNSLRAPFVEGVKSNTHNIVFENMMLRSELRSDWPHVKKPMQMAWTSLCVAFVHIEKKSSHKKCGHITD